MYTVYFFKTWKAIDSLARVPNLFFSDVYLNLLFSFKVGPSLDLSCLKLSAFIISLIICMIKTTCFNNTILMAELEGKIPKVGDLFLPLTSPVLITFTRFLACTFIKVWSTFALKRFYRRSYIFEIITHLLMDKQFPWLVLKHTSKHNFWGLNGTKYWRLFIAEYLQPNKFKKKSSFKAIY